MPGYFGPMICARSLRFSLVFLGILTSWMTTSAQEAGRSEGYIESNWGLANITGFYSDRDAVFPEPLFWLEGVISSPAAAFWKFRADWLFPRF